MPDVPDSQNAEADDENGDDERFVQASIRFDAKRMNVPEYVQVTEDLGRYLVTKEEKDKGAFKTPTLRNVAQRDPYMHNGTFHSLEEIIDFYDRGGVVLPQMRFFERLGVYKLLNYRYSICGFCP
jgi:cytochrome c peroxidase